MSRPSSPLPEAVAGLSRSQPSHADSSAMSDASVGDPPTIAATNHGAPSFASLLHRDALLSVFSLLQLDDLRSCDLTCRQWHSAARAEANGRTVREEVRENQARYDQEHLDELWAQMEDESTAVMLEAAARLRHLFTPPDRAAAVMPVLGPVRLKQLVRWMDQSDAAPKLQHEYLWACLNCAASDRTDLIVEQGAIPVFVRLLRSPHISIREQALWACANVASDSHVEFRDELLALNALTHALEFAPSPDSGRIGILYHAAWFCATLFRKSPQPDFDKFAPPIIRLMRSLMHRPESALLVHVCNGFAGLCRDSTADNAQIEAVVSIPGVAARIVQLMGSEAVKVQRAALEAASQILSGNAEHAQRLIDVGVLPALKRMLTSPIAIHRKTACFSLANLMGNTPEQTLTAANAGVLELICRLLQTDTPDVQCECAFCVSNAVTVADCEPAIARWLAEHGAVLQSLCACLPAFGPDATRVALQTIRQILKVGRDDAAAKRGADASTFQSNADPLNAYAAMLDACSGWQVVSLSLQHQQLAHEIMTYRCQ